MVLTTSQSFCRAVLAATALALSLLSSPIASAEGDIERGKVLGYTCLGCHGIDGYRNAYPSYRVPKLAGQSPQYLVLAMKAYRNGERDHPTMRAQAASLSDTDMEHLASYFAAQGPAKTGDNVSTGRAAVGKGLSATCTACHGENGIAMSPEWPNLAGQHKDYLEHTLRAYQGDGRSNAIMKGLVGTLTEADIRALSLYYSLQPGLFTPKEQ